MAKFVIVLSNVPKTKAEVVIRRLTHESPNIMKCQDYDIYNKRRSRDFRTIETRLSA